MDKVMLLADENSKAWDFSKKIQKYIQDKKEIFIPLENVSVKHFRNGEIDMYVPENVRKKEIYFIQDSTKNSQEWWVELLLLKDLLPSASAESVSFVLPDMFYSRQDRKDRPHVPISARTLASSISPGLKRVITMDLHAPQIQGFYPANVPVNELYSFPEVTRHLEENGTIKNLEKLVIVSPDAGGVGRARALAQRLKSKYSIAFIDKRRLIEQNREISEMKLVGDVADKNVLIVDDIIDSGGSACKAAKLLREEGAKKLYCYATHGIFTKGTNELLELFEKVMISNTHYWEGDGIEIIDVSPIFAEAIYRAEKGLSISKLFE